MLWLAMLFPQLPLDRLGAAAHPLPLALETVEGSTHRIVVVNAVARAQGVCAGQTLAAALARCADLRILQRDPGAERDALQRLATLALGFSSQVGLGPGAGLILEVEASQRLFGGLVPLSRALLDACKALGYDAQAAIAPTPAAARLLARQGERRIVRGIDTVERLIASWPLSLAEIPDPVRASLHGIGVDRFDALLRLPRAELARRFGSELVGYLDRLFARRAEPIDAFRPPEHFNVAIDLPYPIENGQALMFPLARVLRELAVWLRARQQTLLRAEITLRHDDHPSSSVVLGLVRPSGDAEHLLMLARAQVERLALPGPVQVLGLRVIECVAIDGEHRDLFAAATQREDIARAIERVSSRLGQDAVRCLAEHAEHRPERAGLRPAAQDAKGALGAMRSAKSSDSTQQKRKPARSRCAEPVTHRQASLQSAPKIDAVRESLPTYGADRPLFLLDPAQPLELWLRQAGDAASCDGPERIESGWWDGAPVARDYYRMQTILGVRLWVYQQRPPNNGWFVHGLFA